jgi:hypothetical protein
LGVSREILEKVKSDKVEFYNLHLSPYKGKIEAWYVENKTLKLYFQLIWLTVKVVLFPDKKINYQKEFKNIPTIPNELKALV